MLTVNEVLKRTESLEGLYLSGKNDDLLDDPGSLFFQELLNDAVADSTCSNDGEFGIVSGHEPTLSHCGRGLGSNRELSSLLLLLFFSSALLQIRVWVDHLSPLHRHVYGNFSSASFTAYEAKLPQLFRGINSNSPPDRIPSFTFLTCGHRSCP